MTIRQLIRLLLATMAILAMVSAVLIFRAAGRRRAIVALEEQRLRSYKLGDELRLSSDALTRFARTYAVTGDSAYERYYRDVLAIRDGRQPRWRGYLNADHMTGSGPTPSDRTVSLVQLMRESGFREDELRQLDVALRASDSLVHIEETAIHAVKGLYRDSTGAFTRRGPPDQAMAIRTLFDARYRAEKARIMAPVDSFLLQVEQRSSGELSEFMAETERGMTIVTTVFLLFLLVVLVAFPLLRARVLSPVRTLHAHTAGVASDLGRLAEVSKQIAQGDLTQSFATETKPLGSTRRDEVGDLSRMHDTMLGQLQETGAAIGTMTTGLRRANEALSTHVSELDAARRRLQEIFDNSPVAVAVSVKGHCRYANPNFRELLGVDIGDPMIDMYTNAADRASVVGDLQAHGVIRDRMLKIRSRSGREVDALCTYYRMDFDGEEGILGWIVDVTALKEIENALRQTTHAAEAAASAKAEFLANMSHEIRTPMNAILGYAQLLRGDANLQETQRRKLDAILSSGDHLLTLINDVLEMSRIEAGRSALSQETFDLRDLLETVRSMFLEQFTTKGIMLDLRVADDVTRVIESDPGKVRQVLINLVGNALKFTERGGIAVRVASQELANQQALVTIEVEDTGSGISAADQERIFAAFEQTTAGARRGGTGLGLAISRTFARMLGGDITIRSTQGQGSTFTFTFTARRADPGAEIRPSISSHARPSRLDPAEPPKVALVVDDVATNRDLLDESLSRAGFIVHTAETGEEGVAIHAREHPDLTLMDLHMPGMGGFEAIRMIRASENPGVIIVMTASTDPGAEATSLAAGARAVVRKPYREADLLHLIGRLLRVKMIESEPRPVTGPRRITISLAAVLKEIPTPLANELREAALQARAGTLVELANRVAPYSTEAADDIRRLADEFQYRKLLDALDEVERVTS